MSLVDLYANIALESLFESAGECKCEALWHDTPCSTEVVAIIRYSCSPRSPKVCESAVFDTTNAMVLGGFCEHPCYKPLADCWTLIPI